MQEARGKKKNGFHEAVPERPVVRAGMGSWEREEMLAISVLAPAHLAKLGCVVPAQKGNHIPLRTTVLFFPQILYLLIENLTHQNCICGDRAQCK